MQRALGVKSSCKLCLDMVMERLFTGGRWQRGVGVEMKYYMHRVNIRPSRQLLLHNDTP